MCGRKPLFHTFFHQPPAVDAFPFDAAHFTAVQSAHGGNGAHNDVYFSHWKKFRFKSNSKFHFTQIGFKRFQVKYVLKVFWEKFNLIIFNFDVLAFHKRCGACFRVFCSRFSVFYAEEDVLRGCAVPPVRFGATGAAQGPLKARDGSCSGWKASLNAFVWLRFCGVHSPYFRVFSAQ